MTEGYRAPHPERFNNKHERDIYRRGIAEGQRRTKRMLNCMVATNSHLLELVHVLDEDMPVVSLAVPYDLAEQIVESLKKHTHSYKLASKIQELIERKKDEISPALEQAEQELLAMVC